MRDARDNANALMGVEADRDVRANTRRMQKENDSQSWLSPRHSYSRHMYRSSSRCVGRIVARRLLMSLPTNGANDEGHLPRSVVRCCGDRRRMLVHAHVAECRS
jgi:hypothetical protein